MVQNQALLGPMGVAGRFGCVGGLCRLRSITLQRRDGPPAAVGGGQVVGGRHDSPKSEGGKQEASAAAALSRPASHGLASLPLSFARALPPFPVNVITHWARGEGRGDPGSSLPPPLGPPLARVGKAVSPRSSSVEGREAL